MVVKRGNLLVPLDRNPLEIYLLALCVLYGVVASFGLFVRHAPPADHGALIVATVYYPTLALGGMGGIAGAFWRDAITGVLIVRASMIPVSVATLAYAVSVARNGGDPVGAATVAAFAVTCGYRAWQITRHVRDVSRTRVVLPPPGAGDQP